jgi:hypothetical protein
MENVHDQSGMTLLNSVDSILMPYSYTAFPEHRFRVFLQRRETRCKNSKRPVVKMQQQQISLPVRCPNHLEVTRTSALGASRSSRTGLPNQTRKHSQKFWQKTWMQGSRKSERKQRHPSDRMRGNEPERVNNILVISNNVCFLWRGMYTISRRTRGKVGGRPEKDGWMANIGKKAT